MTDITKVLIEFGNSKFDTKIDTQGVSGNLGSNIMALNAVGDTVSEILGMITNTGDKLLINNQNLSDSSQSLSNSSNQQAASLEEIAANLEQMTSNIKASMNKNKEMLDISA